MALVWGRKRRRLRPESRELLAIYADRLDACDYADAVKRRDPDHWEEVWVERHRVSEPGEQC